MPEGNIGQDPQSSGGTPPAIPRDSRKDQNMIQIKIRENAHE